MDTNTNLSATLQEALKAVSAGADCAGFYAPALARLTLPEIAIRREMADSGTSALALLTDEAWIVSDGPDSEALVASRLPRIATLALLALLEGRQPQ